MEYFWIIKVLIEMRFIFNMVQAAFFCSITLLVGQETIREETTWDSRLLVMASVLDDGGPARLNFTVAIDQKIEMRDVDVKVDGIQIESSYSSTVEWWVGLVIDLENTSEENIWIAIRDFPDRKIALQTFDFKTDSPNRIIDYVVPLEIQPGERLQIWEHNVCGPNISDLLQKLAFVEVHYSISQSSAKRFGVEEFSFEVNSLKGFCMSMRNILRTDIEGSVEDFLGRDCVLRISSLCDRIRDNRISFVK